jgi:hypothetical protein
MNVNLHLVLFQAFNRVILPRHVTVTTQILSINIIKFKEIYRLC